MWSDVLNDVNKLVHMTIYVLEIEVVLSFSELLLCLFFTFLYFI